MTEKLLTGTLSLNTNKQTQTKHVNERKQVLWVSDHVRQMLWPTIFQSVIRKSTFCICEYNGANQLRSNCEADQHLCFHYTDSTIPLFSKSKIFCACTARFLSDLFGNHIVSFLMAWLIQFLSSISTKGSNCIHLALHGIGRVRTHHILIQCYTLP